MEQGHTTRDVRHSARLGRWVSKGVLVTLYFAALSALVLWEYRDRFETLDPGCTLVDAPPHTSLYNRPYERLLDWASADAARHVSVLSIPASLEEIQSNACIGRAYTADVLRTLAQLHPAVIVLDKYYSPGACASSPESTRDLVAVAGALSVPVVVGESTGGNLYRTDDACLVRKPQLEFQSPNVHHGLTRLNTATEKLPLQWRVLSDGPAAAHAQVLDSLSLATVKVYDPGYVDRPRIRSLLGSERHPYANLDVELPHATTTDLICEAGTPGMIQRWAPRCPQGRAPLNLMGKLVVIGSEDKGDLRQVLDKRMWGFDLQAHYIEALLSGTFLRTVPFAAAFAVFTAFILMTEAVPSLLVYFRPRWKRKRVLCHAFKRRRYFWTSFWAVQFIVVTTVVCLFLHYLPPLIMFGDIALVAITRLTIFAAESTEHPLLHPHHGKVNRYVTTSAATAEGRLGK